MTFYTDMAAVATELLTEFGTTQTLRRTTAGTYDPVTQTSTGDTTADLTTIGLEKPIKTELINGTTIQSGDRMFVLDDSQVPDMTDKLKVGSEYWSIVNVTEVNPAGTALVYFVQVRK